MADTQQSGEKLIAGYPRAWYVADAVGGPGYGREEANIARIREGNLVTVRRISTHVALIVWLSSPLLSFGQAPAGAGTNNTSLPDAPEPKSEKVSNPAVETTTRFVGYITNDCVPGYRHKRRTDDRGREIPTVREPKYFPALHHHAVDQFRL
jgi:hypothetical protein